MGGGAKPDTAPGDGAPVQLTVRVVERLCHDREGLRAAYLAAQVLIENRWHSWPAPSWDERALLVFAGEQCVAGINYSLDEKILTVSVEFAWCSPSRPAALAVCLAGFRRVLRQRPVHELKFAIHPDNRPMRKLVEKLKLKPSSLSYRVPATFFGRDAE